MVGWAEPNDLSLSLSLSQSSVPVVKAKECGKENDSKFTNKAGAKRRGNGPTRDRSLKPASLQPPTADSGGGRGGRGKLDRVRLVAILKAYGEYPAKYRAFIWRSLLQLPGNHASYSTLLDRGTHSAHANLHRVYPIRSQRLGRVLQRWVWRPTR